MDAKDITLHRHLLKGIDLANKSHEVSQPSLQL